MGVSTLTCASLDSHVSGGYDAAMSRCQCVSVHFDAAIAGFLCSCVPVFTLNAAISSVQCVGGHTHQCCHILGL